MRKERIRCKETGGLAWMHSEHTPPASLAGVVRGASGGGALSAAGRGGAVGPCRSGPRPMTAGKSALESTGNDSTSDPPQCGPPTDAGMAAGDSAPER